MDKKLLRTISYCQNIGRQSFARQVVVHELQCLKKYTFVYLMKYHHAILVDVSVSVNCGVASFSNVEN